MNTTSPTSILVDPSRSHKQRRSHKRVVSFNSMAEVYVLERSPSNSSDDEESFDPSELWWKSREYKIIKKQCISTARRKMASYTGLDFNAAADAADCECRGLERLIDPTTIKSLVTNSIRAVMREQTRQQLDGEQCDLSLAELYGVYSRHSAIRARRFGLSDAKHARAAIRSDWVETLSFSCAMEQEKSQQQKQLQLQPQQEEIPPTIEVRQPKSTSRRQSSDRLPLQENI
eukprot:CAMPEP_0116140132 /NCGR_PEP_ID=MMETSP0329-20121206/13677_1 /TAXON_ID=697910 /ORGANISM="Pseudo-nitzschia arenysensis, Strain B593" /LENGTH=230 /DNA_ID=CAMNT_0003635211 /DNA_START=147 /DNA_END=836 /DNA_ORIENTATION=+